MSNEMDVVGSLKKVARELAALGNPGPVIDPQELFDRINAAAWLIDYIADGLDRELELAFQRANNILGPRQLGR